MTDEQVTMTIDNPQEIPQAQQAQEPELSTSNPHIHNFALHDDIENKWFCTCGEKTDDPTIIAPVQVKSPPVPGAGAKCDFCENAEKYLELTDHYLNKYLEAKTEKLTIPFIEELAIVLKHRSDRLKLWADKKTKDSDELEHPEFNDMYYMILEVQKLRLLQRTLGRFNPTGAIFQLKVNHGMMETEKKVLTGDAKEPLIIELINEKTLPEELTDE